ncbi:MAG: hypothetical protein K2N85_15100 [Lachnospiraceae bacterium]|nr:hypothetical protein [Lachnospiraceae bacterium]
MKSFKKYWISAVVGVLAVSVYPIYMGINVLYCMITIGSVPKERYPKYIIPYTPISLAVILAVLLMPLIFRYTKRFVLLTGSVISLAVFFIFELFLESQVIVTSTVESTLESWQMYMCISFPSMYGTQTWSALDILMGQYSPAFKIHFYMISVVIIISVLNCIYGFGKMIYLNNRTRLKALIVQAVCTVLFLGLCILACFTAFFRDGQITVPAISAFLMGLFFVVLGVTAGTYAGSFVLGKHWGISVIFPALAASFITFLMYAGEMILLSGRLYRFGTGFFFKGIAGIVLAPVDILIILLSGCITAGICRWLNQSRIPESLQ